jgi:hypothetical protein
VRQTSFETVTLVNDWIDISVPVRNGMVHRPGDPDALLPASLQAGKYRSTEMSCACSRVFATS